MIYTICWLAVSDWLAWTYTCGSSQIRASPPAVRKSCTALCSVNTAITSIQWNPDPARLLWKHTCSRRRFGMRRNHSRMSMQHLPTRRDTRHKNHFTQWSCFYDRRKPKIVIDTEIQLVAQPNLANTFIACLASSAFHPPQNQIQNLPWDWVLRGPM